jgi:hypothetical protein
VQLLEAVENGRAGDIVALAAEGANIECKDEVRIVLLSIVLPLVCVSFH